MVTDTKTSTVTIRCVKNAIYPRQHTTRGITFLCVMGLSLIMGVSCQTSTESNSKIISGTNPTSPIFALENDKAQVYLKGCNTPILATGDLDGDGCDEIVTRYSDGSNYSICISSWKDSSFKKRWQSTENFSSVSDIKIGDVDGDSQSEIGILGFITSEKSQVVAMVKYFEGEFKLTTFPLTFDDLYENLAVGDVNGDKIPEIVITRQDPELGGDEAPYYYISLFNLKKGNLKLIAESRGHPIISDLQVVDLFGEGKAQIVVGEAEEIVGAHLTFHRSVVNFYRWNGKKLAADSRAKIDYAPQHDPRFPKILLCRNKAQIELILSGGKALKSVRFVDGKATLFTIPLPIEEKTGIVAASFADLAGSGYPSLLLNVQGIFDQKAPQKTEQQIQIYQQNLKPMPWSAATMPKFALHYESNKDSQTEGVNGLHLAACDMNGDGRDEIVSVREKSIEISSWTGKDFKTLWKSDPLGSFTDITTFKRDKPSEEVVARVNIGEKTSLIIVNQSENGYKLAQYSLPISPTIFSLSQPIAVGDITGDNVPDFLVSRVDAGNEITEDTICLFNIQNYEMKLIAERQGHYNVSDIKVVDLLGDNTKQILVAEGEKLDKGRFASVVNVYRWNGNSLVKIEGLKIDYSPHHEMPYPKILSSLKLGQGEILLVGDDTIKVCDRTGHSIEVLKTQGQIKAITLADFDGSGRKSLLVNEFKQPQEVKNGSTLHAIKQTKIYTISEKP